MLEKLDLRDIPIKKTENDLLNINKYADALIQFIYESETPFTISLQGEWGSGKTSLMNMISDELCDEEKENHFESIWVNTWEFFINNNDEESLERVIEEITNKILKIAKEKTNTKEYEINEFKNSILKLTKSGLNIAMSAIGADDLARTDTMNAFSNKLTIISHLRNSLEKLVNELVEKDNQVSNKGFIIFIDDLDRIDPEIAVRLLEIFKNIFDIEKCIFVLAIDYDVIVKGLSRKYGDYSINNDKFYRAYFDKLIQLPFAMPVSNYKIDNILLESLTTIGYFSDKDLENNVSFNYLLNVIESSIGKNPRRIKRLINSVKLTQIMDKINSNVLVDADMKILNIMFICVQLAYPSLYNLLVKKPNFRSWEYDLEGENVNNRFSESWKNHLYEIVLNDELLNDNITNIINVFENIDNALWAKSNINELINRVLTLSKFTNISSVNKSSPY